MSSVALCVMVSGVPHPLPISPRGGGAGVPACGRRCRGNFGDPRAREIGALHCAGADRAGDREDDRCEQNGFDHVRDCQCSAPHGRFGGTYGSGAFGGTCG